MNSRFLRPYLIASPVIIIVRFCLEATETIPGLTSWLSILFLVTVMTFQLPFKVDPLSTRPFARIYGVQFVFQTWCQLWICGALIIESILNLGTHHKILPALKNADISADVPLLHESLSQHILWHIFLGVFLLSLVAGTISSLIFSFRVSEMELADD